MSSTVIDRPIETIDTTGTGRGDHGVVVYNDEVHTYEQVIRILIKATRCNEEEAYIEAWEIDHYGKCVVHYSNKEECTRVAGVIGSIGLKVEVVENP